ncbi:30S ribosomal protein S20 [Alkalibacillus haloalkaliphilus]|uniref:Small ribosomal subunit protein bS20 n=1 Tax=Alkalibacillus haloalkaliphilus TaxID=94136 RepID=A0A511W5V9_9BACI|nr:30S ribosomal protein S20 [Alkalibacillus haloalkaliphilus]MDV2581045.1 30S ribosomal protein S20 [Alkalibacillus haloalkaliphilus]GEN46484.1 30S ribosomal protein S20 [Alkalibacillus haloalkaliphilus]
MANNPQAVKRIRVNQDKRERNQIVRSDMRSAVKSVETAVKQNDVSSAQDLLKTAESKIDKAVQRGILHKNNGDRKKSSLAAKVNKIAN